MQAKKRAPHLQQMANPVPWFFQKDNQTFNTFHLNGIGPSLDYPDPGGEVDKRKVPKVHLARYEGKGGKTNVLPRSGCCSVGACIFSSHACVSLGF